MYFTLKSKTYDKHPKSHQKIQQPYCFRWRFLFHPRPLHLRSRGPQWRRKKHLAEDLNPNTWLRQGNSLDMNRFQQDISYLPEQRGLYTGVDIETQLTYFACIRGINKKKHTRMSIIGLKDSASTIGNIVLCPSCQRECSKRCRSQVAL